MVISLLVYRLIGKGTRLTAEGAEENRERRENLFNE